MINALAVCVLKYLMVGSCWGWGNQVLRQHLGHKFVFSSLDSKVYMTHHAVKIVLKDRKKDDIDCR